MINFCLTEEEKNILRNLIGKTIIKYRHDPLDKLGTDSVYGRVELFFDNAIVLINYDYEHLPLFGSNVGDHPKFVIEKICENEATSALQNTNQIDIKCDETIQSIILVEEYVNLEWDGKTDEVRLLKALIFKLDKEELTFQGDYMLPLIDILKGEDTSERLVAPGEEFIQPDTKYNIKRVFIRL